MKPGSEDDGSKQEAVSETIVEIVATVTRVTDGMVTAVDMLECLEKEKPEFDRTTAVRFFSHALAEGDETGLLPLHSPGRLPGLVQLLADCMGSHPNEAMLSINRLIYHYAHILEPTETEMTNLEDAIDALLNRCPWCPPPGDKRSELYSTHIPQVLPAIIGIFQEPGNHKKAQIRAAALLDRLAYMSGNTKRLLNESGVVKVMMEAVRVGKDSEALGDHPLCIICRLIEGDSDLTESVLDWGILEVLEQAVKYPRPLHEQWEHPYRWPRDCLLILISLSAERVLDAFLSPGGVVEYLLEKGLEAPLDDSYDSYATEMLHRILDEVKNKGSESQMRRLMSKGSFFPYLAYNLNSPKLPIASRHFVFYKWSLSMAQACLEVPGTEQELWLRRRLIDDSGITDAVQRISLDTDWWYADDARHIFDTYLKNPLPPPPPSNLPPIIYTKNAPQ